ncbi:MAG TPA: hypothetical protein VJ817_15265 [Gemmatimonadales bacterium]|nr:hypothetical protein [Gemmatimonadales bacterium]
MGDLKRAILPALLMLGSVAGAAAQRPAASLAGVWRLNPEKSQEMNPQAVGGYQGTWMGQRGTIGGAGRTGGIPSGGRQEPLPDPTVLLSLMRPILELRIQQSDSTIAISDGSGQFATYPLDGRKFREPQLIGEDIEIVARWKDRKLTIERKLPSLGTIRESYALDPATGELVLEVKVTGSRLPRGIEMRRVYQLQEEK